MRAQLRSLDLRPDPSTLPSEPREFSLVARMIVGPPESPGEESFDITVCTPEWLAEQCNSSGGIYNPRHHVVVAADMFDQHALRAWLEARVREVEAPTWSEVGERLGRLAYWEFEDYRP
jgi:Immunity protein 8